MCSALCINFREADRFLCKLCTKLCAVKIDAAFSSETSMSSCVTARCQNPDGPRCSAYSHAVRQVVRLRSSVVQEYSTLTKSVDVHSYGHLDTAMVLVRKMCEYQCGLSVKETHAQPLHNVTHLQHQVEF